jgi:hypothetical protein
MNARLAAAIAAAAGSILLGCQSKPAPVSVGSELVEAATAKTFDHSSFDAILRAHVKNGMVDYQALKSQHAQPLEDYIKALGSADPSAFAGRDDELAFWLNAYNAFVIKGVLERYAGLKSVMDVSDFFKQKRWKAAGKLRSLDEIENEIIRPRSKDPRIHFILVCAAQSCPPLQDSAMDPARLESQMDKATREAVNNTRYVHLDARSKTLRLTRIMSWYKTDFVEKDGSLEAFLIRYLEEPAKSHLKAGGYRVEFMDYDWRLNDAGAVASR